MSIGFCSQRKGRTSTCPTGWMFARLANKQIIWSCIWWKPVAIADASWSATWSTLRKTLEFKSANCLGMFIEKMLCVPLVETSTLNLFWSTEGTSQYPTTVTHPEVRGGVRMKMWGYLAWKLNLSKSISTQTKSAASWSTLAAAAATCATGFFGNVHFGEVLGFFSAWPAAAARAVRQEDIWWWSSLLLTSLSSLSLSSSSSASLSVPPMLSSARKLNMKINAHAQ